MFRGSGHQPPKYGRLDDMFRDVAKAAKCEGVTMHKLRHYFASGLIADTCDPVTVQRAMGHASASITPDVYSHL